MEGLPPCRRRRPAELPNLDEISCNQASSTTSPTAIQALLRRIAVERRNDELQPFYSIRAVADHFHVPPARVSRIYQRLSSERLLRTVWGSKTLLEPVKSSRNLECRSVGIAVDLSRFLKFSDYRVSILSLQLEIWNHEVNDHLLFFETGSDELVSLCTRNHHPHMNTIVWLLPQASHSQTLLRLHDLGFRVICLTNQVISGVPDCYKISPRCTIRTIVRKQILKI
jgi:DNA-binding transcriptional regulator YhcF (GntR family)